MPTDSLSALGKALFGKRIRIMICCRSGQKLQQSCNYSIKKSKIGLMTDLEL